MLVDKRVLAGGFAELRHFTFERNIVAVEGQVACYTVRCKMAAPLCRAVLAACGLALCAMPW